MIGKDQNDNPPVIQNITNHYNFGPVYQTTTSFRDCKIEDGPKTVNGSNTVTEANGSPPPSNQKRRSNFFGKVFSFMAALAAPLLLKAAAFAASYLPPP